MDLTQEKNNGKEKIIEKLIELCEKYSKTKWLFRKKNWFYRNYKYVLVIIGLIVLFIIVPIILIYISIEFFAAPIELEIPSSLIFSIFAIIISISTLLINIVRIMDFPIDNLTYRQLNKKEDFYELQFSVKNCGHGKLRLKYAFYFIESYKKNEDLIDFLICETKNMSDYLEKVIKRINNNKIEVYSLKALTKECGMYFTHEDTHIETRLHKFDKTKIYLITFLFLTSHRVFFYISKYLIPNSSPSN